MARKFLSEKFHWDSNPTLKSDCPFLREVFCLLLERLCLSFFWEPFHSEKHLLSTYYVTNTARSQQSKVEREYYHPFLPGKPSLGWGTNGNTIWLRNMEAQGGVLAWLQWGDALSDKFQKPTLIFHYFLESWVKGTWEHSFFKTPQLYFGNITGTSWSL